MILTYQNLWLLGAPLLSGFTAVTKLVRVKILVTLLLANGYADFVFLLFLNGFIVSFEPAKIKIFVKHLSHREDFLYIFEKLSNLFFYLATIVGIITLLIVSSKGESYNISMAISILLLVIANYCYAKIILHLSILESKERVHVNRTIKFAAEIIFLLICLTFQSYLTTNIVMALYVSTLILSLLIVKFLSSKYINSKPENLPNNLISIANTDFWGQIKIQLLFTVALFVPILFLKLENEINLLAFYFVFAQLMQIGPLILMPMMNVLYPELSRTYKNKNKFITISLLMIVVISLFYLLILINVEFIIGAWVGSNISINYNVATFLTVISVLEICHISIRYIYVARYSPELLLKKYFFNLIFCMIPAVIIGAAFGSMAAVFLYPILYLASVIVTVFKMANLDFELREKLFVVFLMIYIYFLYGVSGI